MKIKDYLNKTWSDLVADEAFVRAVQALLNPPPWEHQTARKVIETDTARSEQICCGRCGLHKYLARPSGCPVPPPITDPPEVVAEQLYRYVSYPTMGAILSKTYTLLYPSLKKIDLWLQWRWFAIEATPTQRIIVCMMALGKWNEPPPNELPQNQDQPGKSWFWEEFLKMRQRQARTKEDKK